MSLLLDWVPYPVDFWTGCLTQSAYSKSRLPTNKVNLQCLVCLAILSGAWFMRSLECRVTLYCHYVVYILFFSYIYQSGRNIRSSIGDFFEWYCIYHGFRVHFCSYKWPQRLIFDVFIHTNSHVNRTAREIAILVTRLFRRLDYSS